LVAVWVDSTPDLSSTNSTQDTPWTLSTSLRVWQLGVELTAALAQRLALPGRSGAWSVAFSLLGGPDRVG
jgi:hypothetical protein